MGDWTPDEQPVIYASVAQRLVDMWLKRANSLREDDLIETRASAYAMEHCASELQGLIKVATTSESGEEDARVQ